MVELDALWGHPRYIRINGKNQRVPFGIIIDPDLVTFIPKWITKSGTEYAARRVKALKVWAIHVLAGDSCYKENWFRYHHYKGFTIPKLGIFKYLIDGLNNLKVIRAVLTVLNSYKLVVMGRPSLSSITQVTPSPKSDRYIPLLRLYCSLPKVPAEMLGPVVSINTRSKYCDIRGRTQKGPYGMIDEDIHSHHGVCALGADYYEPPLVGKVVPIVDKGKYRNILVGYWAIQLQTKKLSDWLRQWLWSQDEIASGDQSKLSKFCIRSLKEKRHIMSIDLSEATDRLSVDLQIKLLVSMGVPLEYFNFLKLPFAYNPKDYGEEGTYKINYYSNGQPMGLYISFPMFELAHYTILKFATATSNANFCICGDDVVIACDDKDADSIFNRYKNLIERFGGVISLPKTIRSSRLAEGVGAIFLKDIPKEIRIPSGKVSILEAFTPGTWLYQEIVRQGPVGRSIVYQWLSTKLTKEYTYQQRRSANESMVTLNLWTWSLDALRSLDKTDHMPQTYYCWEEDNFDFWRNTPDAQSESTNLKWVTLRAYREALISNKIVSLYKKDFSCNKPKK